MPPKKRRRWRTEASGSRVCDLSDHVSIHLSPFGVGPITSRVEWFKPRLFIMGSDHYLPCACTSFESMAKRHATKQAVEYLKTMARVVAEVVAE